MNSDPIPALAIPYPSKSHVPFGHIVRAIWASFTALLVAAVFLLVLAFTTNDKPTSTSIWVSRAPVFVSVGGVVLKGSLGALFGVALYQHLWSLLAAPSQAAEKQKEPGLMLKEMESLHLASRLSVGMLFTPSARLGWFLGIAGLLCTSVVVPVLQAGVKVVSRPEIMPTDITIPHAQLDYRLAKTGTALNSPEGAQPNVRRSATVAMFGEDIGYAYTKENVTGTATTGLISYTDLECKVQTIRGTVPFGSRTEYYYNFTSELVDPIKPGSVITGYRTLEFTATLNNNTHYLIHTCILHPARGVCGTNLVSGVGRMRDFVCKRNSWINPVPTEINGPATGFYAIAVAFVDVFQGAAWSSGTGRPQENSTFTAAAARFTNRSTLILPSELISHMQRTLWHIPVGARPLDIPEAERGGNADPDGIITMNVLNQKDVLFMTMNFGIIVPVVAVAVLIGLASVVYLIVAPNKVLGRLMHDSIVHTLTVGGRWGPGIRGACIIGLESLLQQVGKERYSYGIIVPATTAEAGVLGLKETDGDGAASDLGDPLQGSYYGGR